MSLTRIKDIRNLEEGRIYLCLMVDFYGDGSTLAWSLYFENTGSNLRYKPAAQGGWSCIDYDIIEGCYSFQRYVFLTDEVHTWFGARLSPQETKGLNI